MNDQKIIYRVLFTQHGKVYEVYAKFISEESLIGFIEVEELIFPEETRVVDPSDERLRLEFKGVKRFYIPMHHILRIDEVEKEGPARIQDLKDQNNVSPFPNLYQPSRRLED